MQQILDDSKKQISTFNGTFLVLPLEPDENITLFGEVSTTNPLASEYANTITYNKLTGEHMANWDIREVGIGWQVIDSFRKLHFGYFAGLVSKVLWAVIGEEEKAAHKRKLEEKNEEKRKKAKQEKKDKAASKAKPRGTK